MIRSPYRLASGRPFSHISQPIPWISSSQLPGHSPTRACPIRLSPLERELMPVPGIQVIGDLQSAALRVPVDVQHPRHRDTRVQLQQPSLIRSRHPGAQQLHAPGEPVPEPLNEIVWPFGQRSGGRDRTYEPNPLRVRTRPSLAKVASAARIVVRLTP